MNSQTSITNRSVDSRIKKVVQTALVASLLVFLACLPAFSQMSSGRIWGSVTDQSGGVIAGATVTVTDTQRGVSRTLTTDDAGQYNAPNLVPGNYTVRTEFKGFQTVERKNIGLEVGKEIRVDISLQPGQVSQTITITEAPPMVETTNATLGGTLNNQTINDLPLNGRNFQNLLTLRPGVTIYPGGGQKTQSSNGIRAEDQVYMLDGLNNTEPYTGYNMVNQAGLAGDTATMVSIDAIQEFNTVENPKAEYGWKPGAVVSIGIKSGTNNFHGTAFAYGRADSFDARNYFNVASLPKTPVELEQFGGTFGGPIKKDKLFFFASYEDQRYSVGNSYNIPTPITSATGGGTAATNLITACNAVNLASRSANSLKLAGLNSDCTQASNYPGLFPVNDGSGYGTGQPGQIVNNGTSAQQSHNGLAKINYHINDHNDISGTTFIGRGVGTFMDAAYEVQPKWLSAVNMWVGVAEGSWVWTPNSSWVNELRAGYDRFDRSYLSADHTTDPQKYVVNGIDYSLNTGVTNPLFFGFPIIRFNNFPSGLFRLGGNWPKTIGPNGVIQVIDHVSYLHGTHAFKFGGEILADKDTSTITANAKGQIRFADMQGFFAGTTAKNSQILIGAPTRNVTDQGYAVFLGDDWRVKPRLTVNLGVRWEMTTVMKEANNLFGNFDPTLGMVQVGKQISSPYSGDHNNVAPRLGLAWDVRGDGKTVVRVGAGIYYEELSEMQSFLALGNALGMGTVPTGACLDTATPCTTAGGNIVYSPITFKKGALNWNGSSVGGASIFPSGQTLNCSLNPCTIFSVQPTLRTPYVTAWNLDIQRAITNNLSLSVAYVGNHGTKLLGNTDLNQPTTPGGGLPFATQYPYLAYIDTLSNVAKSNYNGLQATLTQRTSHGLSFTAGYTYSHALDENSNNYGLGNNGVPLDSYHYGKLYSNSDYDLRHRFTLTTTYAIPGREFPGQLLKGWQINSLVTIQTGAPWYPQDPTNDFANNGEVGNPGVLLEGWNFFGNPSDFTSNRYGIPFCTGPINGVDATKGGCTDQYGNASASSSTLWGKCTAAVPIGSPAYSNMTALGCFVRGNSVMAPPAPGTFPTMSRNMFRDSGYRNWDLSVSKNWKFKERLTAQFRAEFFNVLNHPNFANPYGAANTYDNNNPATGFGMGCGCATPDQAAQNPVLGSGGARAIQLGLKLIF
jgi:hypothetical protein